MSVRAKRRWIAKVMFFAVVVLLTSGWAVVQGAAPEPAAPDPYAVPDGPPAEQVKFIQRVMGGRPPADAAARQRAIDAMLQAADRILAGKPDEAQAQVAVRVRLAFVRDEKELDKLAAELSKAKLPKAAR
ncbi:MAG: hypothetical protein ACYSWU_15345, partial [Planctomycetota bacterium]